MALASVQLKVMSIFSKRQQQEAKLLAAITVASTLGVLRVWAVAFPLRAKTLETSSIPMKPLNSLLPMPKATRWSLNLCGQRLG